jgi:hypothetical protein
MTMKVLAFVALLVMCHADMYLHNMRGSNNRLNEQNRDRDNGNRLFDSQNNNRGGYNVGRVYYYEGEITNQEWFVSALPFVAPSFFCYCHRVLPLTKISLCSGPTSTDVATSTTTARSLCK